MAAQYTRASNVQSFVKRASSQAIIDSLRGMRSRFVGGRGWLGPGHPYRGRDFTQRLDKRSYVPMLGALAQYVAASTFLHAFDGWNYVSRAFDSIVRGDRRTAIHLAYYAELRAGMSLLASRGIGAFNQRHVSIESRRSGVHYGRSTHKFVWDALKSWANATEGAADIIAHIYVDGLPVAEWLAKAGVSTAVQTLLTRQWLKAWSIDLDLYANDQQTRNEMSYRPDSISWPDPPALNPCRESIEPLLRTWEALEPSTLGSAHILDRHLLREALDFAYSRTRGRGPSGERFEAYIDSLMPDASAALRDFLKRVSSPEGHFLLQQASDRTRRPATPLPVMSRAILLLRLASAAGAGLLANAGISLDDLRFWWERKVTELALWPDPGGPPTPTDLWAEIDGVTATIDGWHRATPAPTPRESCFTAGAEVAATQFQRSALWLLSNP